MPNKNDNKNFTVWLEDLIKKIENGQLVQLNASICNEVKATGYKDGFVEYMETGRLDYSIEATIYIPEKRKAYESRFGPINPLPYI